MVKKVICDIDGILCENRRVPYGKKSPYMENLSILKKLFRDGNKIVLFTSRKSRYRGETLAWLRKYNVTFHKLIMNKPKGDIYIDDKAVSHMPQSIRQG